MAVFCDAVGESPHELSGVAAGGLDSVMTGSDEWLSQWPAQRWTENIHWTRFTNSRYPVWEIYRCALLAGISLIDYLASQSPANGSTLWPSLKALTVLEGFDCSWRFEIPSVISIDFSQSTYKQRHYYATKYLSAGRFIDRAQPPSSSLEYIQSSRAYI